VQEKESVTMPLPPNEFGVWAGAICPAIANRRQETFDSDYQGAIKDATRVALLALAKVRAREAPARG
jgi:hypothetical protein